MKCSAILFLTMMVIATAAKTATDDALRTITITGKAEIMVVPDEAVVNLGVETFNSELNEAKSKNDRIVSAVLTAAKNLGVSADNLKTDYIRIQPRYRETNEERVLLGYIVRQSIVVMVKDLDTLEQIISSALEEGANQIHGVEFRASDLRKHKDDARAQALDASKEKAEAMAARLGEKIGRPITITEEPVRSVFPSPSNAMLSSGASARDPVGTMVAGRLAISAKVSVKYELVE